MSTEPTVMELDIVTTMFEQGLEGGGELHLMNSHRTCGPPALWTRDRSVPRRPWAKRQWRGELRERARNRP